LLSLELDLASEPLTSRLRLVKGCANSGDREHAPAGGDQRTIDALFRPGVKDEDVARQRRKADRRADSR
jgi:hypothetical protein